MQYDVYYSIQLSSWFQSDRNLSNRNDLYWRRTGRSVEDETRNAELNVNRNPECWGDFSQLVKIENSKFLGVSRYKVEYDWI